MIAVSAQLKGFCLCWPGAPDWNAITAVATSILAFGVIFAWLQLRSQQKSIRVVETGTLLEDWHVDDLWLGRSQLSLDPDSFENDRQRVNRLYGRIRRLSKRRRYRKLDDAVNDFLEETARLAERIEVYVRRDAADESIIAEHIGWDIVSTYFILQDILQQRASQEDLSYEGFRDLTLRVQDYARVHPLDADIGPKLTWYNVPQLSYRNGDVSQGYTKGALRILILALGTCLDRLIWFSERARDRREFST